MSIRQAARSARSSTAPDPEAIVVLREATVSKLSPRAKGCLTYRVGRGASGMTYIAVSANDGGGYFSREWVSLASVRACLADFLDGAECFPTALLQAVYANRSVNNACFLVAILRHEGVLVAGDPPSLHRCSSDWEAWEQAQEVAAVGEVDRDASMSAPVETADDETESDGAVMSESESTPAVERALAAPESRKGRRSGRS